MKPALVSHVTPCRLLCCCALVCALGTVCAGGGDREDVALSYVTPTQGVWQPAGCVSCEPVCVCALSRVITPGQYFAPPPYFAATVMPVRKGVKRRPAAAAAAAAEAAAAAGATAAEAARGSRASWSAPSAADRGRLRCEIGRESASSASYSNRDTHHRLMSLLHAAVARGLLPRLLLPLAAQADRLLQPRRQLRSLAAHGQASRPASLPQRRMVGAAPVAEKLGDRARIFGEAVVGEAHRLREASEKVQGKGASGEAVVGSGPLPCTSL